MRFARFSPSVLLCALALLSALLTVSAKAQTPRHGLSAFGTLKYPADFTHFDYVNPAAPVGGRLAVIGTSGTTSFDSLNPLILKGQPAEGMLRGIPGDGPTLLFDTLMTRAYDEPDAMYGLVAESATLADDRSAVTFTLRPEARFHDGSPVTAKDIAFSFDILKREGHPFLRFPLRDVTKAEILGPHEIRFHFTGTETRDLPLIVASLPILSHRYYADREFNKTSVDPPMASGPYKVADVMLGRAITYRRDPNYWGWHLPVNRGRFNFAEIRFDYFRDRAVSLEAFKAGTYDLREEFTSKSWATEYDFPAVRDGRVVLDTLPDARPSGVQGFFLNTRRDHLTDPQVRKALDYAFDFEWTNKNLFYGLYTRTVSYFENSDMRAEGKPDAAELALLAPYRDSLPAAVFADAYLPPVTDGSGNNRRALRQADALLQAAGWQIVDGQRKNAQGTTLTIELLTYEPAFERVIAPYLRNLKRLGIDAKIRQVDPAQYESRLENYDFDMAISRYAHANTPGVGLRAFAGSAFAEIPGSRNLAGIKDPVVDTLIEKVIAARDRDELRTAARALDRVLRAGHYWVPHYYKAEHNIAYWNKYARPERAPLYNRGIIETWWQTRDTALPAATDAPDNKGKP